MEAPSTTANAGKEVPQAIQHRSLYCRLFLRRVRHWRRTGRCAAFPRAPSRVRGRTYRVFAGIGNGASPAMQNVFPIRVPLLRDRREDIPLLTRHYVRLFSERMGKRIRSINPAVHERLQRYDWPGNVRELANILERAVIICPGAVLQDQHIPIEPEKAGETQSVFPTLEESERNLIQQALDRTGGVGLPSRPPPVAPARRNRHLEIAEL